MKILVNGLNVYKQVLRDEKVVEGFKLSVESDVINNFAINHTFSVLHSIDGLFVHSIENGKVSITDSISKFASNNDKLFVLSENGNITKFDLGNFHVPIPVPKLLDYESINNEKIIDISCGATMTITYSNQGTLFNNTNRLEYNNCNIVSIRCGREHCLLLDKSGNVYSFGCGSRGQLGHSTLEDEPEPILIEALAGLKIVQIAAGGWHSCAISKDGDLYTWGWNSNGQLGVISNNATVMAVPQITDVEDAVKVAAGSRHTIILLGNGKLYGCGWNKYKQLNMDPIENIYTCTYLHSFEEQVSNIWCGPCNSAVLCT